MSKEMKELKGLSKETMDIIEMYANNKESFESVTDMVRMIDKANEMIKNDEKFCTVDNNILMMLEAEEEYLEDRDNVMISVDNPYEFPILLDVGILMKFADVGEAMYGACTILEMQEKNLNEDNEDEEELPTESNTELGIKGQATINAGPKKEKQLQLEATIKEEVNIEETRTTVVKTEEDSEFDFIKAMQGTTVERKNEVPKDSNEKDEDKEEVIDKEIMKDVFNNRKGKNTIGGEHATKITNKSESSISSFDDFRKKKAESEARKSKDEASYVDGIKPVVLGSNKGKTDGAKVLDINELKGLKSYDPKDNDTEPDAEVAKKANKCNDMFKVKHVLVDNIVKDKDGKEIRSVNGVVTPPSDKNIKVSEDNPFSKGKPAVAKPTDYKMNK